MNTLHAILIHPITLVGAGSAMGGIGRFYLGRWISALRWADGFAWGTFLINVLGSFLLGVFAAWLLHHTAGSLRRHLYLLAGTGFCGGFTTFSTFELETFKLIEEGRWLAVLLYVGGSVLGGLGAFVVGMMLGGWFTSEPP